MNISNNIIPLIVIILKFASKTHTIESKIVYERLSHLSIL